MLNTHETSCPLYTSPPKTSFKIKPNTHYIMLAGGYGAAPLKFLAKKVSSVKNSTIDFCLGARNKKDLLFIKDLKKISKLHITTDDGSQGTKGKATDILPNIIKNYNKKKTLVVTCGPEIMEKKVLDFCNQHKTSCEISIERYIKCGVGVCGQCAVDGNGICLCKEGPVVSRQTANKITEFGFYSRDNRGIKNFCEVPI